MMKRKKAQTQTQSTKPKAPKGALSATSAVRLWNGETISRSMLIAEPNGMSIFSTEMTLDKKSREVQVTTSKRATVNSGRIHPLDKPVQIGQAQMGFDQALTAAEAAQRASKWLKRAKALDALARQGDEEAREKAEKLREKARTLCRAYGLRIEKGEVTAK